MRTRPVVVTKRDGTLESFSASKLRASLSMALQACCCDARAADPLTRAVGLHLTRDCAGHQPSTEYIYYCVCTALAHTGLGEVAEELAAHRRLRESRRRRVRVLDQLKSAGYPQRWRKTALVATLRDVYGLQQTVARFLAGRIEEQVFGLGYRQVSKTLLAELMRSELMAWGLLDGQSADLPADQRADEWPVFSRRPKEET
jgi:hypothetical protein